MGGRACRICAGVCGGASLLAAALLSGCQSPPPPPKYAFVTGLVTGCRPDTGEVSVDWLARGAQEPTTLVAHVNEHSELYIDDRLAPLAELHAGDEVELQVYRDQDVYVVTTARVRRRAAAPPLPAVLREALPRTQEN